MKKYEIAAAIDEINPNANAKTIYKHFSKAELIEWLEETKNHYKKTNEK